MKQQILDGPQESLAVPQALASDHALLAELAALCSCLYVPAARIKCVQEGQVLLGHILAV